MEWSLLGWSWQSWVGNLCYLLLAASYMVTNMVSLRVLAVVALSCEAVYLFAEGDKPLWVGVIWAFVFVGINLAQLALIFRERSMTRLTAGEKTLKERLFPDLGDIDFHYLLRASETREVPSGTVIAKQAERLEHLHVITKGWAEVNVNGQVVATLGEGSLVGEVSFFRDDVATASVIAKGELQTLSLGRTKLRELMKTRESLSLAVHQSMGKDMGAKLSSFAQSTF